jgi:hypothetical protein
VLLGLVPPKPYNGVLGGCKRFRFNPILSYASAKIISVDDPFSTKSLPRVYHAVLASITKALLWGKPCNLTSSSEKVIGI